jgi:hypothetical protein
VNNKKDIHILHFVLELTTYLAAKLTTLPPSQAMGAMMTHPLSMRPCKMWTLDYRSLFDTFHLTKNKNGLCVPVLIFPHKFGPNEQGQFVPIVNTSRNVERYQTVHFYRTVIKYL